MKESLKQHVKLTNKSVTLCSFLSLYYYYYYCNYYYYYHYAHTIILLYVFLKSWASFN